MDCIKCSKPIPSTTRSIKYCSYRCSKLYLKAQYKKRTRNHQLAYQRSCRKARRGGNAALGGRQVAKLRGDECLNCGTTVDLQVAQIKPRFAGGAHATVITLCRKHHMQFDNLLREFWRKGLPEPDDGLILL
jgi:hypothetical protein